MSALCHLKYLSHKNDDCVQYTFAVLSWDPVANSLSFGEMVTEFTSYKQKKDLLQIIYHFLAKNCFQWSQNCQTSSLEL